MQNSLVDFMVYKNQFFWPFLLQFLDLYDEKGPGQNFTGQNFTGHNFTALF
jgi:hypothetical protein